MQLSCSRKESRVSIILGVESTHYGEQRDICGGFEQGNKGSHFSYLLKIVRADSFDLTRRKSATSNYTNVRQCDCNSFR